MSGRGEWLPWRRDWSRTPNIWKLYLAFAASFAVLAALNLATGKLFLGVFYLAAAITWSMITGFVRNRSRFGSQRRDSGDQPN